LQQHSQIRVSNWGLATSSLQVITAGLLHFVFESYFVEQKRDRLNDSQACISHSFLLDLSAPMLILKGAHGYSLNLANTLAHLGATYLAGLVVLFALLQMGH